MNHVNVIRFICVALIILSTPCFGGDSKLQLTSEEKAWLDKKHTVHVRIGNAPPFMLTNGKTEGIAIDYLTFIFNHNDIKIKYVSESEVTWPQALKYIKQHEVVDMVPTAKITTERKKDMLFTDDYIFAPWAIFTRTNAEFVGSIEDLNGKTVSVEEGYVIHNILKRDYQGINLEVAASNLVNYAEKPIEDLATGLVDAYIGNLLSTTYIIQTKGYTNIKVAAPTPFENHNQAMAIRNDWPELVSIINKTLSSMTQEEHAAIRNKWLTIRYEYGISTFDILKWVLVISIVLMTIFGIILIWNRKLKKEVVTRQKSEVALLRSQEKIEAILDNSPITIWCFDGGRYSYISKEWFRYTGQDPSKPLTPENWIKAVHPDDWEKCGQIWEKHWKNKTAHINEFRIMGANGDIKSIHCHAFPIFDKEGNFLYFQGYNVNITEQKIEREKRVKLEAQLAQAQKMESIGTLAGGIAHDFNNILGAIIGYTEMARDDSPEGSSVANDLDKVLDASGRAADLVRQILAFSRQGETEHVPIQPASIVKKTIEMLRSTLPTTIEITQDIDPETGLIFADPTQIHQILMNLCANAFHAMEETGGKLGISLKEIDLDSEDLTREPHIEAGTFIQLSVSDSGTGIPLEVRDKIFDPYFTTKGIGKGTGLGLSIIHGIVKSYGGFITLYSEPGQGTIFHIFVPIITKEMLPNEKAVEAIQHLPVGKEKILFIDDEDILADMGKDMLERLGYHVTVRKSSLEALETFKNQPDQFDLVFTDQTMPGMTGIDLARRMLQIRPDIPIILCTGYSSIISEDKAKSRGIREFALKPLTKKNIAELIRKVFDT